MAVDLQIPDRETQLLLDELAKTADIPGDVVEFGCYMGDTSVQLARAMEDNPDKWLYLYDSFEGLPAKTAEDQSADGWRFKEGELKASPDSVAHKFKKYQLPAFICAGALVLLVAIARVLAAAHYLSDVSWGAFIMLTLTLIANEVVMRVKALQLKEE